MNKIPLPQYKQAFRSIIMDDGEIGFIAHLVVYLLVNAMLTAYNLIGSSDRLWFYVPILGWGLGLSMHYLFGWRWLVKLLGLLEGRAEERVSQLRERSDLTGEITLPEYKKAFRQVVREDMAAGFVVHLVIFFVMNAMMVAADFIYSPESIWFFFPFFGWGAGLIIHYLLGCRWVERIIKSLELLAENKSREASIIWLPSEPVHRTPGAP